MNQPEQPSQVPSKRLAAYFGSIAAAVFSRRPAGRGLTVLPEDVYIVSYIRSGSTWARFLFGNLVNDEPVTFKNLNRVVPIIYEFPDRVLRSLPRLLKSHEYFDPRYPRVIHIVRDPRDVAVSFYYYNLKVGILPDGYPIDDFVTGFVNANTVAYADRLGSWEDHTLSWIRMRQGRASYCLLRYEDLLADTAKQLSRTLTVLGRDIPLQRIERAIDLSSSERMRSLEKVQWKYWTATKGTRQDIPFVREAKSGGWKSKLPPASAARIEAAWGDTMQLLGYSLSASERKDCSHADVQV